jgi:hypothetical protein
MKILRSLTLTFGFICIVIRVAAALSGGGPVAHVVLLGQSLIIGGAIIIAGAVISAAITSRDNK